MIFRPYYYYYYYYYDLGCAAYLFGCSTLGEGSVVYARADDGEAHITFAAGKGLRLTRVIDTHVHADHRSGGPELARRTGGQYCVHESADVTFLFTALHDGDELELGNTRVRVLRRHHRVLRHGRRARPSSCVVLTAHHLSSMSDERRQP